ncbi:MAG: PilW family protein [Steroidobacteraceae bacterium]
MQPTTRAKDPQRGYSLVEVMVAITIALFLLGGTLTVVQHTRSTYTAQNQLAQLQDNERTAMALITDVIQSAGYYPNPHTFSDAQTLVSPSFTVPGTPNIAAGPATAPPGTLVGQTITVRYAAAPGDNVFNCRGDQYTGTALFETWENTFSVVKLAAVQGVPQYQLQCTLWSLSTNKSVTTALVTGVQNMSFQYAVNTAGPGTGSCADRYKATAAMLAADWPNICSVKVTLTFPNPFNPPGGTKPTLTFTRVIAAMNAVGT